VKKRINKSAKKKVASRKTSRGKTRTVRKVARKTAKKTVRGTVKRKAGKVSGRSASRIKLSRAERKSLAEMLIRLRERMREQILALKDDSLRRHDSVNSEEDGTDAYERQLALSLASSENDVLFEIDEALRRIDGKIYGMCEECNKRIEKLRLKALPFVRLCIDCQSRTEKGNRTSRALSEMKK